MTLDRSAAHAALRDFCQAMNRDYAGKYWVMAGTLLGIVRDDDFIAYDGDVDFGMHAADFQETLIQLLESHGFRLRRRLGAPANGLILKFLHRDTKIDIFFFYSEGNTLWHSLSRSPGRLRARFEPFKVVPRVFQGVQLFVPEPAEAVLAANYGPDWRSPVKRWHYAYSAYNVSVNGHVVHRLWYLLKNCVWQIRSSLRP